jgi:hypothetical protein
MRDRLGGLSDSHRRGRFRCTGSRRDQARSRDRTLKPPHDLAGKVLDQPLGADIIFAKHSAALRPWITITLG